MGNDFIFNYNYIKQFMLQPIKHSVFSNWSFCRYNFLYMNYFSYLYTLFYVLTFSFYHLAFSNFETKSSRSVNKLPRTGKLSCKLCQLQPNFPPDLIWFYIYILQMDFFNRWRIFTFVVVPCSLVFLHAGCHTRTVRVRV